MAYSRQKEILQLRFGKPERKLRRVPPTCSRGLTKYLVTITPKAQQVSLAETTPV